MDYDIRVLKEAFKITLILDMKYRRASFNEKVKLKEVRDEAFSKFTLARLKLLEEGVICTNEDLEEMKALREKIHEAARMRTGFLTKLLPLCGPAGGFIGVISKFI